MANGASKNNYFTKKEKSYEKFITETTGMEEKNSAEPTLKICFFLRNMIEYLTKLRRDNDSHCFGLKFLCAMSGTE